ncbi:esterase family protein [Occultella aeris]|uniref:Enterobactin/ferric enterobactin esterase n=1 Tax=Occultella aeris TaxID=2761496 RepID=A0A7M4DDV3_9MICO|nr:alpha/beta hydrolase-fold protein [Occultella aeris]VZO35067.1 enterobactin/ferric enterobactin esterase [Occultella aeris]
MTSAVPYSSLPDDVDGLVYEHGPDSVPRPAVLPGRTIELTHRSSDVYPGTVRSVWIHIPAACTATEPSAVMFFQDGWWYLDPAGQVRAGIVLDNLTSAGAIRPTVGVFVDPGLRADVADPRLRRNRNVEYDAFDDRYATFLIEEIAPLVRQHVRIIDGPDGWGLCGGSSGGNCALTTAWNRPDRFRRVIAYLSSFAQMPGGNPYPDLISNAPRKPLRVFMHAARYDLGHHQKHRNWYAENLRVSAALDEAGYDHRLVVGDGGHNPNHGGVLLPDALRWVWRN